MIFFFLKLSNLSFWTKACKQVWRIFILHLNFKYVWKLEKAFGIPYVFVVGTHRTKLHSKIWLFIHSLISKGYLKVQSWSGPNNSLHVVNQTTLNLNLCLSLRCVTLFSEEDYKKHIIYQANHDYWLIWGVKEWNTLFYMIMLGVMLSVYIGQSKKQRLYVNRALTYMTDIYVFMLIELLSNL